MFVETIIGYIAVLVMIILFGHYVWKMQILKQAKLNLIVSYLALFAMFIHSEKLNRILFGGNFFTMLAIVVILSTIYVYSADWYITKEKEKFLNKKSQVSLTETATE